MPKPTTKTIIVDGEETFTTDLTADGKKYEGVEVSLLHSTAGDVMNSIKTYREGKADRVFVDDKAVEVVRFTFKPTNTSGRMLVVLMPTSDVLEHAKELRSVGKNDGDLVAVAEPSGMVRLVGYGTVETIDESPEMVKSTTSTVTRDEKGGLLTAFFNSEREETKHTAQLVWAGKVWSDIVLLSAIPDEHAEAIKGAQIGELLRGWNEEDATACRLQQLTTRIERLKENTLLALSIEHRQDLATQFAHTRTVNQANRQANESKRLPLEARQVNALTLRHRDANTRKEIIQQRGIYTGDLKFDKNGRRRILVELGSGTSRGKVAQLSLFPTEGINADLGALVIEELMKHRDAFGAKAFLAILTKLTEDWGGIDWNDEGRREIFKSAERLLTRSGESLNKSQRAKLRELIGTLADESVIVHYESGKRKKKGQPKPSERVSLVLATRAEADTGEVTRVALNPEIVKRVMGLGRGVWMPPDVFRLGDNDGGYAFSLAFTLAMRWQVGARRGWERLDKTLDSGGLLEAYRRRVESEGAPLAQAWLNGLLVGLRSIVGQVEIDNKLGRVLFKKPPRWLKTKRLTKELPSV